MTNKSHIIDNLETRETYCGEIAPKNQTGPLCDECNYQFQQEWTSFPDGAND